MNPLKRLAGQTAIYGIPSILGRFLNYLLVPLYTYGLLTQQEYGVVNIFYSFTALLMVVLTYGMETAFFRFTEMEKDKSRVYSTGLISLMITTSFFLILVHLFPRTIASWVDYSKYPNYIIWFAWILALDVLAAIPFARLRALNRPILFATIKSVNIVTTILLNLFFLLLLPFLFHHFEGTGAAKIILLIYRPDWTIEYIFISNLIASLLTLAMLIPQVLHLKWILDMKLWRRMLIYAIPLLFAGMAGIINETFDRLLLRYLLPPDIAEAQVGIYSACYKIAILIVLFIQAYRFAAEPFFFSQMKKEDAKVVYARVMDFFIITVSLIFLTTLLFLDNFFIYFIGPKFRAARNVIPILMLAKVFLGVYYNLSIWYKLTGKTMWGAGLTIAGAVVSLSLNIFWIPLSPDHLIFGYLGSAWATFFCYSTMMVLGYLIGQQFYPIPYNLKKFFGYLGLALLLYFISRWIHVENRILSFGFSTSLLLIFISTAWFVEKPHSSKPS